MLSTVMDDKSKIEQTIDELERHKRDALVKTWEKVNGDFGGIFAELLPGNFAKLQPPDGQDVTQGLEVKVQLGNVWKQSLTELSGGQRLVLFSNYRIVALTLGNKVAHRVVIDHVPPPVQTSTDVHPGRDRRGARSVPYSAHRPTVPLTFQRVPVHCGEPEGRLVHERQRTFQGAFP